MFIVDFKLCSLWSFFITIATREGNTKFPTSKDPLIVYSWICHPFATGEATEQEAAHDVVAQQESKSSDRMSTVNED